MNERDVRKLLYECIKELDYVQSAAEACGSDLCATPVGKELVARGMDILGVADLSTDYLPEVTP